MNKSMKDLTIPVKETEESGVYPLVKVRLVAGKAFFGPGTQQLMELIEQTGSLQDACLSMKLSYSKGSRMIKDAERKLGFSITERWAGGAGGGGSRLTEEGRQFLKNYRNMASEVQEYTEQIYKKYFGSECMKSTENEEGEE